MEKITCFAEISIQGNRVFRFVNSTQDRAVYDVIGFNNPSITIIDYRQRGLDAIQQLLETGQVNNFAEEFNSPARIELQSDENDNILIELDEIGSNNIPTHMLWIAVGLRDSIPVYDYCFELLAPLKNGSFALATIFNIPKRVFLKSISG
jgi:hypothetical protein